MIGVLDDPLYRELIDVSDMLGHIRSLPAQIETAWRQIHEMHELPRINPSNMVILGMGGSAIGGDIARSLTHDAAKIPIIVHRDYGVPACVNSSSLVVAVSHSGDTEEIINGFEEARRRGATIFAIASGGRLIELAQKFKVQYYRYESDAPPRASLGFLLTPILALMNALGLYELDDNIISEAIYDLHKLRQKLDADVPSESNRAKQLAMRIHGRVGLILASAPLTAVARRWKTQMNENANTACFFEELPEMCHNTIVGFEHPSQLGEIMFVIILRSAFSHQRNKLREDIVAKLLTNCGMQCEQVSIDAVKHPLSEILQMVMLGDFVSYYLALLNRVDPTAIINIDYLKASLQM
ncbi:MAG: bifunctional phosphoglucose/phosphomannose isomerase [Armatimonadota bacterium]|nr:bifunctional phosphoglucose/phosphomannose isomerase [Armatimonadota bacterium]MCX7777429.1 bifunctional phosphoglucose/phosphomannose isomerase [Armatimonadota bacterium]MDW8025098.1 bifunctional phosphoglucose/phosphomannose isomerase [Armatimonadota bacterium]